MLNGKSIAVVEVNDEADRDQILAEVIDERAATGTAVERPALRVQHEALLVPLRRDLPELLQTDAILLRIDVLAQPVHVKAVPGR